MKQYQSDFDTNKAFWDSVVDDHYISDFYDVDGFIKGNTSLTEIELPLLQGNIDGKSLLHLQCHFGMDSISMARLGATVTATDISSKAIEKANQLNQILGTDVNFVESNTYGVAAKLGTPFDYIFTSYGALVWLPDLEAWADGIAQLSQSGTKVIIAEFHPAVYMFDFPTREVRYHYFNQKTYRETEEGSYASGDAKVHEQCFWQHSLDEVFEALRSRGFSLDIFKEYPFSPYNCFENMKQTEKNRFVFQLNDVSIPHVYLMQWVKQ